MRIARTTMNIGNKFWGCPNFKVRTVNVVSDFL